MLDAGQKEVMKERWTKQHWGVLRVGCSYSRWGKYLHAPEVMEASGTYYLVSSQISLSRSCV
jgi:hypothetical protein